MSGPTTPHRPSRALKPGAVLGIGARGVEGGVDSVEAQFTAFVAEHEPRLRRAFVASYGSSRGREATAEALAFAWEHWGRLSDMHNAPGYLFRVGQSRTRRKRTGLTFAARDGHEPVFEPGLGPELKTLTARQRTAVVLVHGFSWTLREVAELTGTKVTTVQNHLERGLAKLRQTLQGDSR